MSSIPAPPTSGGFASGLSMVKKLPTTSFNGGQSERCIFLGGDKSLTNHL